MNLKIINSDYNFSYYNNLCSAKEPNGELDINQLIEIIKYGYIKDNIENLRKLKGNKEEYSDYKKFHIPCVTLSGIFSARNAKSLIQHSGLMQIDIDNVKNYTETFNKLIKDTYTYVVFRSPGAEGIKIVVKTNPEVSDHPEQFYALEKYYLEEYDIKIDQNCKDVARCMLLSYDPDIFCNPFSIVFEERLMPVPKEQNRYLNSHGAEVVFNSQDKNETIQLIIHNISASNTDLTDTYENWIKIGYALSTEFGEGGRAFYHQLSQYHPEYSQSACNKQYDNLHKRNNDVIKFGTIIHFAKEKGIEFKTIYNKEYPQPPQPKVLVKAPMKPSNDEPALEQKSKIAKLTEKEQKMHDALRNLRLKLSHQDKVRPYWIFGNNTLNEIVQTKPTTKQQLLSIKTIGQKKVDHFGQEILDIIKENAL